jgi:hypothetical protein
LVLSVAEIDQASIRLAAVLGLLEKPLALECLSPA